MPSAAEYCQAKVAAPGSELYYILQQTDADLRSPVLALHCCYQQVRDCIDQLKEPAVAAAKLNWWQLEFERLFADAAQHPATQLLSPVLAQLTAAADQFQLWVSSSSSQLQYDLFPDQTSLDQFCRQQLGALFVLLNQLLTGKAELATPLAELGGLIQQIDFLCRLPADLHQGRLYLPLERLEAVQLSPEQLQQNQPEHQKEILALLNHYANWLRQQIRKLELQLPATERLALYPILAHSRLALLRLDKLQKHGFHSRPVNWPLPSLWTCWRLKRREQRAHKTYS